MKDKELLLVESDQLENYLDDIVKIYEPYVEKSNITFDYDVPTKEEQKLKFFEISKTLPLLICKIEGKTVGYAYAQKLFIKPGYQWNVELTVYIEEGYTHKGIGKAFYSALIEILKLMGFHNVYAVVTADNKVSISLHEHFDFRTIGVHKHTAFKNNKWHDVVWFEKQISKTDETEIIKKISDIDKSTIEQILSYATTYIK